MRKDEEVKELFYWGVENLEKLYNQKATVTVNAPWVTIKFGDLVTVKGRGYKNAFEKLDEFLEDFYLSAAGCGV